MRFEVFYIITAPITFFMLVQFAALAWIDNRAHWLFRLLAALFIVQDVIYNATVGTLLFWERPREWLFTDRLKRWGDDWRVDRFKRVLNRLDPGHV